ncbi:maleylpyruvate isomerase family mycothiol-dependent enzyme [Actinomycetospora chlora]
MADTRSMAREERAELADLLAGLAPEQWDAPTLCAGWAVRDVVAHVIGYDAMGLGGFAANLAASGFRPDRANQRAVDALRDHSPAGLVELVRRYETPHGLTAMFGGRIALTDGAIHQQDIRRPLGLPRTIPADRLREVLDYAMVAPPVGASSRIRGLRLVATDVDWSRGSGPEVTGPGEALLMAAAGRADALDELEGPGHATFARRVAG